MICLSLVLDFTILRMTIPNATTPATNFEKATNSTLTGNPLDGSYIQVFYNGQELEVGDGTRLKECYFSSDGGNTAKYFDSSDGSKVTTGDEIYFNSGISGFILQAAARISTNYLINK